MTLSEYITRMRDSRLSDGQREGLRRAFFTQSTQTPAFQKDTPMTRQEAFEINATTLMRKLEAELAELKQQVGLIPARISHLDTSLTDDIITLYKRLDTHTHATVGQALFSSR